MDAKELDDRSCDVHSPRGVVKSLMGRMLIALSHGQLLKNESLYHTIETNQRNSTRVASRFLCHSFRRTSSLFTERLDGRNMDCPWTNAPAKKIIWCTHARTQSLPHSPFSVTVLCQSANDTRYFIATPFRRLSGVYGQPTSNRMNDGGMVLANEEHGSVISSSSNSSFFICLCVWFFLVVSSGGCVFFFGGCWCISLCTGGDLNRAQQNGTVSLLQQNGTVSLFFSFPLAPIGCPALCILPHNKYIGRIYRGPFFCGSLAIK